MKSKVPISESDVSHYDFGSDTYYLSQETALDFWKKNIHKTARHRFEIPFGTWLDTESETIHKNWASYYNSDDSKPIEDALTKVQWDRNDIVYFIWQNNGIIETSWKEFVKHWMVYMAYFDDCPIIYNISNESRFKAIEFTPRGLILAITGELKTI
ncbi:MAG: hypothetical protein Crog4KO_23370 [Crocinitomicaceae bacterium]